MLFMPAILGDVKRSRQATTVYFENPCRTVEWGCDITVALGTFVAWY